MQFHIQVIFRIEIKKSIFHLELCAISFCQNWLTQRRSSQSLYKWITNLRQTNTRQWERWQTIWSCNLHDHVNDLKNHPKFWTRKYDWNIYLEIERRRTRLPTNTQSTIGLKNDVCLDSLKTVCIVWQVLDVRTHTSRGRWRKYIKYAYRYVWHCMYYA